jgi:DNA-binding response OmpR family regulator
VLRVERRNRLLLVEPDSLLRRIVVSVARDLDLAVMEEATGASTAEAKLDATAFDGLVLALDEAGDMLAVLRALRLSRFRTSAQVPVVVMSSYCDEAMVSRMRELEVQRLLLKPFKVKSILDSVTSICS